MKSIITLKNIVRQYGMISLIRVLHNKYIGKDLLYKVNNDIYNPNDELHNAKNLLKSFIEYSYENYHCLYKYVLLPCKSLARKIYIYLYVKNNSNRIGDSVYWKGVKTLNINNPLITVIVPNYNHEKYLEKRLESIYKQTYKNIEVLLLDDCSTDNSRKVLKAYKEKYPEITKTVFNERNSGYVFKQWEKGISLANGDYIWIAESDDWCDLDFLEKLLLSFEDETISLAFSRTDFIQEGIKIYDTETYLVDTNLNWNKSFVITAHNLTKEAFAIKNVIPNVSSVLFKKRLSFSDELKELWKGMKLCGDWAFYLDTIKGSTVAYVHEVTNYYRIHKASTSLNIQKTKKYYEEHEQIAKYVVNNYNVPNEVYYKMLDNLKKHYLSFNDGKNADDISELFSVDKILECKNNRKPNIMMCVFSLQSGGGETFPIILANEMKQQGYAVTLCNFNMDKFEIGIKNMIRNDMSYVDLSKNKNLGYIINQFGVDIIHSQHGSVDEIITHFIKKGDKCKHIISLHGMYEAIEKQHLKYLLDRVGKSCSSFVYATDKNLLPFKDNNWDISNFYKIGNGLRYTESIPIAREELGISKYAFVLCVVTRAIPSKGWEKAIKAVTISREDTGKDIQLILIGDGIMYDRLKNNVPSYVHLLGFKSNIRDFFSMSDMGLLPSEFKGESFPLVIIDCLFSGKPMIVTDIGESGNQIQDIHGNIAGAIVPMKDGVFNINDLSQIIDRFVEDKDEYTRVTNNVMNIRKKFFIDIVAKQYLDVYNNAMDK